MLQSPAQTIKVLILIIVVYVQIFNIYLVLKSRATIGEVRLFQNKIMLATRQWFFFHVGR